MQPANDPDAELARARSAPSGRSAPVAVARVLLGLAAVGALAAAATTVEMVRDAGPDTRVVEIWRLAGLVVFSGLFALLAYRPLHYAGIWELVILHKLALTFAALTYASDADGAAGVALADGILTGILFAAYGLTRAWRAWSQVAPAAPMAPRA